MTLADYKERNTRKPLPYFQFQTEIFAHLPDIGGYSFDVASENAISVDQHELLGVCLEFPVSTRAPDNFGLLALISGLADFTRRLSGHYPSFLSKLTIMTTTIGVTSRSSIHGFCNIYQRVPQVIQE